MFFICSHFAASEHQTSFSCPLIRYQVSGAQQLGNGLLKTPTPTWKCTSCSMQMSYLYASAFLSKTFANSLNMQKQYIRNIVWEKSNEAYPLSIRAQTTKPHFDLFLPAMNVKENVFFFRARVRKGIAWHIDASSVVWTLINNGKLW